MHYLTPASVQGVRAPVPKRWEEVGVAWRRLCELEGPLRRTWERRAAAGVARTRRAPEDGSLQVWVGWPVVRLLPKG